MIAKQRYFQLSGQWCVIHVPERPNGFALFILGDASHVVEREASLWMQHIGKSKLLVEWLQRGYTVFDCHLYGANWGSTKAVKLAKQLIYYVLKKEILNERIYIFAEGMGALVALQLMNDIGEKIRAIALMNPCIDLAAHIEHEKKHKFFYKRLMKQLKLAYESEKFVDVSSVCPTVPMKIWQVSGVHTYPSSLHARPYAQTFNVPISYYLPEKKYTFGRSICQFFEQYSDV